MNNRSRQKAEGDNLSDGPKHEGLIVLTVAQKRYDIHVDVLLPN